VAPYEYTEEVNPDCNDINGFVHEEDTDDEPMNGEVLNFTVEGQNGSILLNVTDDEEGEPEFLSFSITGPFAAGAVIVKGSNNANVYDYRTTMAGQIEADETLHSPINPSGGFAGISHVAFCIVPDGDNT
jgi:hypothetical protein